MTKKLTVTELVRNFSDYINRVVYRGEQFVLTRGRKPIAELRPIPAGRKMGDLPDILESLPRLSKEEANAFARDIAEARDELSRARLKDPWES